MLDKFWDFFLTSDPLECEYIHMVNYDDDNIRIDVVEKLNWVLSQLNDKREYYKFDYELITNMKTKIIMGGFSLTERGVDYLNLLISTHM